MTTLETERLRIVALTPEQFGMLLDAPERLERSLGVALGEPLDGHALEAMRGCTPKRTSGGTGSRG